MDEEILAAEEAIETSNGNTSEENTQEESQPTEQTAGEISEGAPEQVETEERPRKGAQSRIKELNTKVKSLEEKLAELTSPVGLQTNYQPQFNPTEPIVADGEEISVQELNQRIAQRDQRLLQQANAHSELRMKQTEAVNRINSEAVSVIRKYPQLDPDNENFDQELSDSITEATESYVKAQPYSASVSQFVDKLMKPYTRAVEKEVGKATANIAKQVTETALRPTSIQKGEKKASELSIAELEAKLGVVNS